MKEWMDEHCRFPVFAEGKVLSALPNLTKFISDSVGVKSDGKLSFGLHSNTTCQTFFHVFPFSTLVSWFSNSTKTMFG